MCAHYDLGRCSHIWPSTNGALMRKPKPKKQRMKASCFLFVGHEEMEMEMTRLARGMAHMPYVDGTHTWI